MTLLIDRIKKPTKDQGTDEQRGRLFARIRHADADVFARESARAVPARISKRVPRQLCWAQSRHQRAFATARSGRGRGATQDWTSWADLLAVPLAFEQGDPSSTTFVRSGSIPRQRLAEAAAADIASRVAQYQLVERARLGWSGTCGSSSACRGCSTRSGVRPACVVASPSAPSRRCTWAHASMHRAICRSPIAAARSCAGRATWVSPPRACMTPRNCSPRWWTPRWRPSAVGPGNRHRRRLGRR